MIKRSYVITVLFDTKKKTFLGRKGKWVSAEEFLRDPPASGRDSSASKKPTFRAKVNPDGFFECIDGILYFCQPNLGGGYDKFDCGPCPW